MAKEDFHSQTTIPDLAPKKMKAGVIPAMVGPYKIESLLSKGGMSLLYLGTHPDSSTPLVIKVLSPKFLKNKEIVSRFMKESQIIRLTNHPNIVKLYGHGKWEKGLYIAMEFIQGVSLRQFILQKSLSRRRALDIILQVAYALCHLHTHGVIHRDLKPENILITESGEIKVIDFGIAQLLKDYSEERITQSRRLMGTPTYMSPEQKENPMHLNYSSDIFSLGIITYELILGRLSHGVIHLSLLPKGLRTILDKALKIDPKERYQDIVDFITDISQYIQSNREGKEASEEEVAEEWVEKLANAQEMIFPEQAPNWPQIEVGVARHEAFSLTGMYYDFFQIPGQRYLIVIAEPLETGIDSLISISVLRGMVRMVMEQRFRTDSKEASPVEAVKDLNRAILRDTLKKKFSFSLLMLKPNDDQLTFISCGTSCLFHIEAESEEPRIFRSNNPPLGSDENAEFMQTTDNWNVGDQLTLCSSAADDSKEKVRMYLAEQTAASSQVQAEKLLKAMTKQYSNALKRNLAVLKIRRI